MTRPTIIFQSIEFMPGRYTIVHKRMIFYVAPNGRLLLTSFHGIGKRDENGKEIQQPNDGIGIGRVVREMYEDGTTGPSHFLRYMPHFRRKNGEPCGYGEENTKAWYPYFMDVKDAGFREACTALLNDTLARQKWWEEERNNTDHGRGPSGEDGFFGIFWEDVRYPIGKAFLWWRLPDGRVASFMKEAWNTVSADRGKSWDPIRQSRSFASSPSNSSWSKFFGQRTSDGRYVLAYDINDDCGLRYPWWWLPAATV